MAHTNVKNTAVLKPGLSGGIFRFPLGTVLPKKPHEVLPTIPGWNSRLGGCDETGFTLSTKRDQEKKKDWNGDKVRAIQTGKDDTGKFVLIEPKSPEAKKMIYGNANVEVTEATALHGTIIEARSNSDLLEHASYIVDTRDGNDKVRKYIPDAQVSEIGDIIFQSKDWQVYEVTLEMFPDLAGNTWYETIELDDKLVETSVVVTLGGTAATGGDFKFSVSGEPATITFNSTKDAFKTAVAALPNVKTADVTGSAGGPWTVKVTTAGVPQLAVDGTNLAPTGATVSLAPAP